jgi:hypothetical protein
MRPLSVLVLLGLLLHSVLGGYLYGTPKTPAPPPPPPPAETAVSTVRAQSKLEWLWEGTQRAFEGAGDAVALSKAVAQTATDRDMLNAMWKDAVGRQHPWLDGLTKAVLCLLTLLLAAGAILAFGPGKRVAL